MQSVYILLVSALQLLNLVSANPNLPQDFKTNAINIAINAISIAQNSLKATSTPALVTTVVTSSDKTIEPVTVTSPVFGNININPPTMKPAYTLDELLKLFYDKTPDPKLQFTPNRYFPVVAYPEETSVTFAFTGLSDNFGDVRFNDQIIMTPSQNNIEVDNLTPSTDYHYQFIYKENGREDTVIDKIVTTHAHS